MKNLGFDVKGMGRVISDGRLYVAAHQRDYYWNAEKVIDLFDDYKNATDHGEIHFLGTIVLRESPEGFEVVDGQQRIATTSIIIAAIRDVFFGRKDQISVETTERDFLFSRDRTTEEILVKLQLNIRDNSYFRTSIVLNPNDPERLDAQKPTGSSNQRLKLAADTVRQKVSEMLQATPVATQKAYLKQWLTFIEESATVMALTVPDTENAYLLFETLNDRGMRVSEADLVKNYIFGLAFSNKDKVRLEKVITKWSGIVTMIESLGKKEDFIDFLRIACTVKYGLVKERDLFHIIKKGITTAVSSEQFVHELEEFATDYVAMLSPDHPKWNNYPPSIRRSLRTLALFDVMQIRYVMLSVARSFSEQQAAKAFHLFVNWIVRFFIAGAEKIGRVDKRYANLANTIYTTKDITTAVDLADEMAPDLANDKDFIDAFSVARVSQGKLARYYLDSMERSVTESEDAGLVPDEDTFKVNLEHIIPLNIEENWPDLSLDKAEELYNRIGNMVLLNAKKNSKIGNLGFKEKKQAMAASPFTLTRSVAAFHQWGEDEVYSRQKELAKIAVKTWTLKPK